jgi:hypothetical protein
MEGNGGRAQVKGLDFCMLRTPNDGHAGERAQRLQLLVYLAVPLSIIALAVGFRVVGVTPLLLFFPPLGILAALLLREAIWHFSDRSASLFGRLVHSADGIPHAPGYSAEEALVARGDYLAAAAAYRAHADANPASLTPLIRLAEITRRHLGDHAEAERLYLEARRRSGDATAMANQLIDLYRSTGNRGRLMGELARYSAAHPGTPAGEAARKELHFLKEDRTPS